MKEEKQMNDAGTIAAEYEESAVDAVFVIGTGSKNNNEELKYALRNLEHNCPFIRNVYISGECPSWINTSVVKHLKWPDRFSHAKDANIIDKLRHACEQPGIAKKILFCSDDQFQTRICTWDDFMPRWLRQYKPEDTWYADRKRVWHTRLRQTLDRDRARRQNGSLDTSTVYYYQPHMWMQIDRDKFIEYAKWSEYPSREDTIIASGYFNFIDAGGKQNFDHIFISPGQSWPVASTHIAYSDSSYTAAMEYLKTTFRNPSKYENACKSSEQEIEKSQRERIIISKFRSHLASNPTWTNVSAELLTIESMGRNDIPGWKFALNDLISRWVIATNHGADIVPVDFSSRDPRISLLILAYRNKDSYDKMAHLAKDLKENRPKLPTREDINKKVVCSKCEERRMRLAEERKQREEQQAREAKEAKAIIEEQKYQKVTADKLKEEACITCAAEHMATAVAYLNSNMMRPTALEAELAIGEIHVAAKHLLALEQNSLYNKCMEIINSHSSQNSLLAVTPVKSVLSKIVAQIA